MMCYTSAVAVHMAGGTNHQELCNTLRVAPLNLDKKTRQKLCNTVRLAPFVPDEKIRQKLCNTLRVAPLSRDERSLWVGRAYPLSKSADRPRKHLNQVAHIRLGG